MLVAFLMIPSISLLELGTFLYTLPFLHALNILDSRIAKKWFMNGLESVRVAKVLDLLAITTKGGKRSSANVCPVSGLVFHSFSLWLHV